MQTAGPGICNIKNRKGETAEDNSFDNLLLNTYNKCFRFLKRPQEVIQIIQNNCVLHLNLSTGLLVMDMQHTDMFEKISLYKKWNAKVGVSGMRYLNSNVMSCVW